MPIFGSNSEYCCGVWRGFWDAQHRPKRPAHDPATAERTHKLTAHQMSPLVPPSAWYRPCPHGFAPMRAHARASVRFVWNVHRRSPVPATPVKNDSHQSREHVTRRAARIEIGPNAKDLWRRHQSSERISASAKPSSRYSAVSTSQTARCGWPIDHASSSSTASGVPDTPLRLRKSLAEILSIGSNSRSQPSSPCPSRMIRTPVGRTVIREDTRGSASSWSSSSEHMRPGYWPPRRP